MADIKTWSTAAASNNASPPNGAPEGWAPADVNNVIRENMAATKRWYDQAAWLDFDHTPTQQNATSFKIAGDHTSLYVENRRIRADDGGSFLYGDIATATYAAPDTTVIVTLDSGSLTSSMTAVSVAILTPGESEKTGGVITLSGVAGLPSLSVSGTVHGSVVTNASGTVPAIVSSDYVGEQGNWDTDEGLRLKWDEISLSGGAFQTWTFAVAFSATCLAVFLQGEAPLGPASVGGTHVASRSAGGFTTNNDLGPGGVPFKYLALGK